MRNPNRYGTVTKLSGKRRRPWIVKEGKTGQQKIIGYATTRDEAMILLANYNQNPWDIQADKITFKQLYELWLEKRAPKLGKSNRAQLKSAYKHCIILDDEKYKNIKSYQMQDCIDSCGLSYATQSVIKNLFGHLDRFAMELDIISKCYSDLLTSESIPESNKKIFTDDEVNKCWNNIHLPWVDSVIFLLYTGFRKTEMLELKISNIDLENLTITGGIKTAAGKNRIIPIHSKIVEIVKKHYLASKGGYLFEYKNAQTPLSTFTRYWDNIMQLLEMKHTPHECRHTFRSRLDSAGANKVCIDRLMGHKSVGTGERVYTHKNIEELRLNIELITN